MDVTPQDVANILTLIAPGYFATKAYSIIYARGEKELSRTVLESVIFSLPIVALYDYFWKIIAGSGTEIVATNISYVMPLLVSAIALGWIFAKARNIVLIKRLSRQAGMPGPDHDFIRTQFRKLTRGEPVSATLHSGEVFSGTPQGGSVLREGLPQLYYFNNVAWFDNKTNKWDERPGSIILELKEIRYIETAKRLPRD